MFLSIRYQNYDYFPTHSGQEVGPYGRSRSQNGRQNKDGRIRVGNSNNNKNNKNNNNDYDSYYARPTGGNDQRLAEAKDIFSQLRKDQYQQQRQQDLDAYNKGKVWNGGY